MALNEEELEQASLEILQELGYEVILGPDIASERANYSETLLLRRLENNLCRLNPSIPISAIDEAIKRLQRYETRDLILNNHKFHKMLIEGIPVEYQCEGRIKSDYVRIVDFNSFANNEWLAVNQFTIIEGSGYDHHNRRPDILLFVNGIPIVVVELKNPADEETTIRKAFNQLETYKKEIPSLFHTNELLVVSDGLEAKMGSLSANWERYITWRTIDGLTISNDSELQMEILFRGILDPKRLLDYIRYFITFENDGNHLIKKSAAYHQYHAVNEAIEQTMRATGENGDRRIGVIWHTQGSGKSLTMLFYASKLIQYLNNPTLLVITDRNDLDNQLFNTFALSSELIRQHPKQGESRQEIQQLLKTSGGGVIFSTIQKFLPEKEKDYPLLSDRKNVVVIADEAHRSQYSFKKHVSGEGELKEGFAAHIRTALPNASFIGFTGTPIELADRNTPHVFGDYISVYDISQAIEDRTTVPIYLENRLIKLKLDKLIEPDIDKEFEEITEDEEEYVREKLKSKWARVAELARDPDRIKKIAEDIVLHFETRLDVIQGKGMIVCMARENCVDLYDEIIKVRPDWHSDDDDKGEIKVVMSGSASDDQTMQPHIRPKHKMEFIKKRMVDPDDPLKLVIVRDMWLTGFDAPSVHTMYVDKPMKGHSLMQAIARVNRVYKDKPGGLIVDYIGIAYFLKLALSNYKNQQSKDNTGIPIETAIDMLKTYFEVVQDLFFGFDYSIFMTGNSLQRLKILPAAMEHILQLKGGDGKKRFLDNLASLNKAFSLTIPHEEALKIRDDLAFFQAVRAGFVKATAVSGKKKEDIDHAIRQLISKAVISEDVIDIFKAAGLQNPEISILSEKFLKEVEGLEHKNLAIEMLNKLLNDQIRARSKKNLVQARSFSEMLKAALIKYENRTIEAAKILEELIDLAHKMHKALDRGVDLGLTDDEVAFYEALTTNPSAVKEMEDENLKQIAKELVAEVRKSATIDFTVKESVQAKMRTTIKRLLKKYKYPPDQQQEAVRLIMEQAQLFGEQWALLD